METTESVEGGLLDERTREHYDQIRSLNENISRLSIRLLETKGRAKAAKEAYDSAVDGLRELITRGPDMQGKLPFGESEDKEQQPSDAWRDEMVAENLGLTPSELEKLEENDVYTIGQLVDLDAGDGIGSIKGFGQAKVDKIKDQLVEWLSENRDKFGESAEEDDEWDENEDEEVSDEDLDAI